MGSGSLTPTWTGHVTTTRDALVLFEACLNGTLHHVPRRPHDRERGSLIKSGSVFIYEENASGIKRWTDGVPWSPSRILGNFLVYRELTKPFPPGEKKRATKRSKRPTKPGEPYPRANPDTPASPTTPGTRSENGITEGREGERALIGSLVDSYGFKDDGLVKKTMSVSVLGIHHHLVSYYKIDEVLGGQMQTVAQDAILQRVEPRVELISRQNFRAPLDGDDAEPQGMDEHQQMLYWQQQQQNEAYYQQQGPYMHGAPSHAHFPNPHDGHFAFQQPVFTTSGEMHPNASYTATSGPTTQAFQPLNHSGVHQSMPQPQYSHASYGAQYVTHTQSHSAPSVPADHGLRSGPQQYPTHRMSIPGHTTRQIEAIPPAIFHGQPPRDSPDWNRPASGGVYAPSAPQPSPTNGTASYTYPLSPHNLTGQQSGMPPPGQGQSRSPQESAASWNGGHGHSSHGHSYNPMPSRQPHYPLQHT